MLAVGAHLTFEILPWQPAVSNKPLEVTGLARRLDATEVDQVTEVVRRVGIHDSIEDGTDPSPSDVAAMDAAMTGRTVRLLLSNAQVTSPTTQKVRDLATSNGIPVVGVAETIPAGQPTFQAWQIAQAKQILTALGG
jgi:hypothetical protein